MRYEIKVINIWDKYDKLLYSILIISLLISETYQIHVVSSKEEKLLTIKQENKRYGKLDEY